MHTGFIGQWRELLGIAVIKDDLCNHLMPPLLGDEPPGTQLVPTLELSTRWEHHLVGTALR